MTYQLVWKKLTMEKNKILNFQLQRNAILVAVVDQNPVMMQDLVQCVEEEDR